jgi:hypothetical protein
MFDLTNLRQTALHMTGSAVIAVLVLSPALYQLHKRIAPPLAAVDLMQILEAHSQQQIDAKSITAEEKSAATVAFAKKLSAEVESLSKECNCVLLNKAAFLSEVQLDLTSTLHQRVFSK